MTTKATLAFYVDDIKRCRRSIYTDEEIATNATNDVWLTTFSNSRQKTTANNNSGFVLPKGKK